MGSYFPDQGSNLCHLHCRQTLNCWTTREAPVLLFSFAGSPKLFLGSASPFIAEVSNQQLGQNLTVHVLFGWHDVNKNNLVNLKKIRSSHIEI